jgi:hypothetical protein
MKDLINKVRNKLLEHRAYELAALFFQGFLIGSLAMLTVHYIMRM